jgi:hypothetical protein
MLITLTVDGWCVLPVFPFVSQALIKPIYYVYSVRRKHYQRAAQIQLQLAPAVKATGVHFADLKPSKEMLNPCWLSIMLTLCHILHLVSHWLVSDLSIKQCLSRHCLMEAAAFECL